MKLAVQIAAGIVMAAAVIGVAQHLYVQAQLNAAVEVMQQMQVDVQRRSAERAERERRAKQLHLQAAVDQARVDTAAARARQDAEIRKAAAWWRISPNHLVHPPTPAAPAPPLAARASPPAASGSPGPHAVACPCAEPAQPCAVWRREYLLRSRKNKKPGAWPGSLVALSWLQLALRLVRPSPTRANPSSASVPGSGTVGAKVFRLPE